MKNLMKIFAIIMALGISANAGNEGGGGNTSVAEFYQVARAVAVHVRYERDTLYGVSGAQLIAYVGQIKVESSKKSLSLRGKKVEAINYPDEKRIELDTKAWNSLSTRRKVLLVIHELLGLLKKPDPNYEVSSKILSDIQNQSRDWASSFDLILSVSQSFSSQSIVCKIFDNDDMTHEPVVQFKLKPIAGGVGEIYQIGDDYKFDVSVSNTQASIDVYPPCSKKTVCSDEAIGGKRIAYALVNYMGEFKDIDLELPKYNISCSAK